MKMKIFVYNYREFDEAEYFQKFAEEYGVELGICTDAPTLENAHLAEGYKYVSIITSKIDAELMERFHELGVKMISTRTIGYDHVDLAAAEKFGISVSNVSYSPECVADYTVMLILMSIRKMKRIMQRAEVNDFSLPGIQGRELPNFTVGVLGTGRIGRAVIRDLSGFGCRIYAYDKYENESVKEHAQYADLDTIFRECDLITQQKRSVHPPGLPKRGRDASYGVLYGSGCERYGEALDRELPAQGSRGGRPLEGAVIRSLRQSRRRTHRWGIHSCLRSCGEGPR